MKLSWKTLGCVIGLVLAFHGMKSEAFGEVTHKASGGFQVTHEVDVLAEPAEVYTAFVEQVGNWWQSSHTYSGDAKNLSIEAQAGGRFLEKLTDGGSVEHLRVVFVQPGKAIRLSGGLGPLQPLGVSGALSCSFAPGKEGGTRVKWVYNVSGETAGGLEVWAAPVDGVLGAQVAGLKSFVEASDAPAPK